MNYLLFTILFLSILYNGYTYYEQYKENKIKQNIIYELNYIQNIKTWAKDIK